MDTPTFTGNHRLHEEHRDWLRTLDFYQDQIKIFQNELSVVLRQHPDLLSIIEHVDEYRVILLKKLQHIDDLRCGIQKHERAMAGLNGLDHPESHQDVKADYLQFVKKMEQFKHSFRRFVAYNN